MARYTLATVTFALAVVSLASAKDVVKIPIKAASQGMITAGYVTEIQVGTPPQKFNVSLSTSDTVSWLTSSVCESPSCVNHPKFYKNRSTSFIQRDEEYFLSLKGQNLYGLGGNDDFNVGELHISGQPFVEALQVDAEWYTQAVYDGYLALGLGKGGFIWNSMDQNPSEETVFTIWFNQKSDGLREPTDGELTWRKIESSKYSGELVYAPLEAGNDWKFKLDEIATTGTDAWKGCTSGCHASIETELSEIFGPNAIVDPLHQSLGAILYDGRYFFADCNLDKIPSVNLTIAGQQFSLKPEQYIMLDVSPTGSKFCYSRIVGSGWSLWRLGDPFVRHHYLVFEFYDRKLGIAPAV